jgi:acyl carrier protein
MKSDHSDKDIEDAVYSEIEGLIHRPRNTFRLSDDLVLDLKIDSDDLSFLYVPDLEKAFEIKVPVEEWNNVFTGEDTVKLLKRHIQQQQNP